MNILVLHGIPISSKLPDGVLDIELAFPRYDKKNNYLIHNAIIPFPEWLKNFPFDAIFVTATFLGLLTNLAGYRQIMNNYSFIRKSQAVKIAFPQDDYWCSENKEFWYLENEFDLVYPVCQENTWFKLIPNFIKKGGNVMQGYTSYITPKLRKQSIEVKEFNKRSYDVVYRASGQPSFPNRLGTLKAQIGQIFIENSKEFNLTTDISTKDSDKLLGEDWFNFLRNSRATIATTSGSSLLVRNVNIAKSIAMKTYGYSEFSESLLMSCGVVESDLDTEYVGISPRMLEAAATRTVQIIVPHKDEKTLKRHFDYLELDPNCTNIREIVKVLKDYILLNRIAESCWNQLQSRKDLDIHFHIEQTIEFIYKNRNFLNKNESDFYKVEQRHQIFCEKKLKKVLLNENIKKRLKNSTPEPIKNIVRNIRIKL